MKKQNKTNIVAMKSESPPPLTEESISDKTDATAVDSQKLPLVKKENVVNIEEEFIDKKSGKVVKDKKVKVKGGSKKAKNKIKVRNSFISVPKKHSQVLTKISTLFVVFHLDSSLHGRAD